MGPSRARQIVAAGLAIACANASMSVGRAAPPTPATEAPAPAASGWTPPGPELSNGERARAWWLRANELREAGQFREAAVAFRQSYDAMPTSAALYNVALSLDYSKQPLKAITAYTQYLDAPDIAADERRQIEDRISELEGQTSTIVLAVPADDPPVSVQIDGRAASPSPEGVRVLPGPHDVIFERGEERQQVRVVVAAGDREVVRFEETPAPVADVSSPVQGPSAVTGSPQGDASVAPAPRPERPGLRLGLWTSVAITGAAGVSLVALGVSTTRSRERFESSLCAGPCPDGVTYDPALAERFYNLRTATNVMIGVTAVAAVSTTILAIIVRPRVGDSSDRRGRAARVDGSARRWRLHPQGFGVQF